MMDDFLDAPFPAIRGQAPDLFHVVDIPEDEIVIPRDGRLMHLLGLGLIVERVFEPVLRNPDAYLMPRFGPFEELPHHWEEFFGNDYLGLQEYLQEELEAPEQIEDTDSEEEEFPENDDPGVQEHLQEELEAPDQVEDMDNEEEGFPENDDLGVQEHLQEELEAPDQVEDMDNEEETMGCAKKASQDVDAMSSASQPGAKRVNLTTNDLLLKNIGSSASSVSSFGLLDSAMPDASPAVFGSISEPVTTSEVQELNI